MLIVIGLLCVLLLEGANCAKVSPICPTGIPAVNGRGQYTYCAASADAPTSCPGNDEGLSYCSEIGLCCCNDSSARCPNCVVPLNCSSDVCEARTCPNHPKALCVINYCGSCEPRFFVGKEEVTASCLEPPQCKGKMYGGHCLDDDCVLMEVNGQLTDRCRQRGGECLVDLNNNVRCFTDVPRKKPPKKDDDDEDEDEDEEDEEKEDDCYPLPYCPPDVTTRPPRPVKPDDGTVSTVTTATGTTGTGTMTTGTGTTGTGTTGTGTTGTGTTGTGTMTTGTGTTTTGTGSTGTGTMTTDTASTGTASTDTKSTGTASTGTKSTGTASTGTKSTGTASTATTNDDTASTATTDTGTTGTQSTGTASTATTNDGTASTATTKDTGSKASKKSSKKCGSSNDDDDGYSKASKKSSKKCGDDDASSKASKKSSKKGSKGKRHLRSTRKDDDYERNVSEDKPHYYRRYQRYYYDN